MSVQERYDQWHRQTYERAEQLEPTAPWHLMARKHIPEGSLHGLDVLEIGCGPGQFARWLAEQGGTVIAGDFSAEACRIAADTCAGATVEVHQLDAQHLVDPLGPDRFDLICCLETLEHVPDHDLALREIVAVTKPGGRIVISTPNYLSPAGPNRLLLRLVGKRWTEMGQPINNVMIGPARPWKLRRLGCRIDATEGALWQWQVPGTSKLISLAWLNWIPWLAQHTLVVATKR